MPSSKELSGAMFRGMVFALPLLCLAGWLEVGLRRMPTALSAKRAGFEARASQAELLVLGASEGFQGLSPDLLGVPGYNLATVGQDLHYDRLLFDQVLPRLPHLKAVLLAVSYPSLEYRLPSSPEHWRQFQYSQVWGLPPEDPDARWDLRRFSALALMEPWPALQAAGKRFAGEPIELKPDGWQPLEPVSEDQLDLQINDLTARKRAHYHNSLLDEERHGEGLAWLSTLVRTIVESGAKPILVTLPVSASYARAVEPRRLTRLRAAAQAVAAAQGGLYWDLFQDRRFDDRDFSDPDHLNRNGAAKLARAIGPMLFREMKATRP